MSKSTWVYLRSLGNEKSSPLWLVQSGDRMWAAYTANGSVMLTVRAASREAAKAKLWQTDSKLKFFR